MMAGLVEKQAKQKVTALRRFRRAQPVFCLNASSGIAAGVVAVKPESHVCRAVLPWSRAKN
jgi:hypothetical protein